MKKVALFFGLFILLTACNNADQAVVSPTIDAEMVVLKAEGNPDQGLVQLSIEGMMCEVGCAGKINKELFSVEGVSDVAIVYEDNRETDFANVKYDPSKVKVEDLIQAVQMIADGDLYHVSKAEITQFQTGKQQPSSNKGGADEGAQLNFNFELPGVADIIQHFLPLN